MSMLKQKKLEYGPGRTIQSFKDETDINKLLVRAQRAGTISHLQKYQGEYGDFSDIDGLLDAHDKLDRLNGIFAELPGEIKREFHQNPAEFARFVNDPANIDQLDKVLPALAKPGRQNIDVSGRTPPQTPSGVASAPEGAKTNTAEVPIGSEAKTAPEASQ